MDENALRDTRADRSRSREGTGHRDLLIVCGAAGGPLFATLAAAQVLTRDGFDLAHQPLSLLSLGPLGWVQVANFVTTGVLMLAFAVGMRQVLTGGPGSTWAPLLVAISGAGLVAGGLFLPDPALGYPPGTPDAIPSDFSWHGTLHAAAPPLSFAALVACCLVFARRFLVDGRRGWAAYSLATAVATLTLSAWPSQDGASSRPAVAILVTFVWTTLLALRLRKPV